MGDTSPKKCGGKGCGEKYTPPPARKTGASNADVSVLVLAAASQSVPDHVDDVGCNYGTAEEAWKPIRCVLISEE